mgnify:CR=1 FL=1
MTFCAISASWFFSAQTAFSSDSEASPLMRYIMFLRSERSSSILFLVFIVFIAALPLFLSLLAETAGNIVFRALVVR